MPAPSPLVLIERIDRHQGWLDRAVTEFVEKYKGDPVMVEEIHDLIKPLVRTTVVLQMLRRHLVAELEQADGHPEK